MLFIASDWAHSNVAANYVVNCLVKIIADDSNRNSSLAFKKNKIICNTFLPPQSHNCFCNSCKVQRGINLIAVLGGKCGACVSSENLDHVSSCDWNLQQDEHTHIYINVQLLYTNTMLCFFVFFSFSDPSMIPETTTELFEPIFPSTFPVKATENSKGNLLAFIILFIYFYHYRDRSREKPKYCTYSLFFFFFFLGPISFFFFHPWKAWGFGSRREHKLSWDRTRVVRCLWDLIQMLF